jgi:hypothetical protein
MNAGCLNLNNFCQIAVTECIESPRLQQVPGSIQYLAAVVGVA